MQLTLTVPSSPTLTSCSARATWDPLAGRSRCAQASGEGKGAPRAGSPGCCFPHDQSPCSAVSLAPQRQPSSRAGGECWETPQPVRNSKAVAGCFVCTIPERVCRLPAGTCQGISRSGMLLAGTSGRLYARFHRPHLISFSISSSFWRISSGGFMAINARIFAFCIHKQTVAGRRVNLHSAGQFEIQRN